MKLVIKYQDCYADEFDVYGLFVIEESKYNASMELITLYFKFAQTKLDEIYKDKVYEYEWQRPRPNIECGFGTNEAMIYQCPEDFIRSFVASSDDPKIVEYVESFGYYGFGWSPLEQMLETIAESDEFFNTNVVLFSEVGMRND